MVLERSMLLVVEAARLVVRGAVDLASALRVVSSYVGQINSSVVVLRSVLIVVEETLLVVRGTVDLASVLRVVS